jgi:hypothetical protein
MDVKMMICAWTDQRKRIVQDYTILYYICSGNPIPHSYIIFSKNSQPDVKLYIEGIQIESTGN